MPSIEGMLPYFNLPDVCQRDYQTFKNYYDVYRSNDPFPNKLSRYPYFEIVVS